MRRFSISVALALLLTGSPLHAQFADPRGSPALGIFGTDLPSGQQDLDVFEKWLNRRVDYSVVFGGYDNGWDDYEGSVWYITWLWRDAPARKLLWAVPLIPTRSYATLANAAGGQYDDHYRNVATMIAAHDPQAVIRVGWEFNGGWYPWMASQGEQQYIGAYRDLVKVFRGVSPNFQFVWNPNLGAPDSDPALAYPGDDVVNYIGMDIYENTAYLSGTPDERWNYMLTADDRGLNWLASFAALHMKPIAFPEWATNYDDGSFIQRMHDWMLQHDVVMQSYWDNAAAFNGSFAYHPKNGELYKRLFVGSQTWMILGSTSALSLKR
jgi:hypothetical protein